MRGFGVEFDFCVEGFAAGADAVGGDFIGAVTSIDARGGAATSFSSAFPASSSCAAGDASSPCSGVLKSKLALKLSAPAVVFVACSAGLSGRDPMSEDALESLLTAFASRSCSREFGRLREELRDAAMWSAFTCSSIASALATHPARPPASCPAQPFQAHLAWSKHFLAVSCSLAHLRPISCPVVTPGRIWRCSTSLCRSLRYDCCMYGPQGGSNITVKRYQCSPSACSPPRLVHD